MSLEAQLRASVLTASLPVGEILARLRRGNETIQDLTECLDKAVREIHALERINRRQTALIDRQRQEIDLLRAHTQLMEAKERRRLSLVVDNTPALLRPQGE